MEVINEYTSFFVSSVSQGMHETCPSVTLPSKYIFIPKLSTLLPECYLLYFPELSRHRR